MRTGIAAFLVFAVGWTSASAEPADAVKTIEAARKGLATLQAQLDELAKSIAERDKAKDAAVVSSGAQIAELRSEIVAIRQAMVEQKRAVDESGADVQRLEAENKSLKAKLDEAVKARDQAAKAGSDVTKARDDASILSQALEARTQEIAGLKAELAASEKKFAELQAVAAKMAATKDAEAVRNVVQGATETALPVPASPQTASAGADVPAPPGGIKQWKQPDGTLFFGDTPRVPGSKLIAVIGASPTPPAD